MNIVDNLAIFADNHRSLEDSVNEGYFSWYPCDCCNERLGGQRYDIVAFNPGDEPEDFVELSVCEDCYVELVG